MVVRFFVVIACYREKVKSVGCSVQERDVVTKDSRLDQELFKLLTILVYLMFSCRAFSFFIETIKLLV